MKVLLSFLTALVLLSACQQRKADPAILTDQNILHRNMDQLTQVIIHDMFPPPNASRIYAYTSLAAYEATRFLQKDYPSLTANLQGFPAMPVPEEGKTYNYLLAATHAFFAVAENITFSKDSMQGYKNALFEDFRSLLDKETFDRSLEFGQQIGQHIMARAKSDHYKETRGMAKFIGSNQKGQWRPTPPDYNDAAEPHWGKMKTLVLDSAAQIRCPAPPVFSEDTNSAFYKTAYEVYTIGANLTEEQKTIAKYWDDNPFVTQYSGHLMYGNKKITPVGHWIGITTIAAKQKGADAPKTAQAYALTAVSIYDAFVSCWNDKFQYNVVRPITVTHEVMSRNWQPYLQTPPFPEHPSGHSAISAAAATVLTELFGAFPFEDTSDFAYIGMKRNFSSFEQAAQEASISRVYGGIHYRTGVDAGATQGRSVGEYTLKKLLSADGGTVAVK
ncbi:MAG TPA: vanadium-dependent haloperoxidase [Flavisolibacter sp.]|jgi:hypothetical protein|nr:vanadium-dependent haloperoxidase [Flavisolibacter sp.]